MANLHFSWSDSIQAAFSSCLFCFRSPDDHHDHDHEQEQEHYGARQRNGLNFVVPPPRARPDELEGLLAGSDSPDAETLSLHSNIGDERRRKKRRKPRKGVTLFGYSLFGRPPIHLDSDDEEGGSSRRSRTISTSTLDSDAAPLDASALDEQAIARLAAATAAAEEEQRKAKEERRRLRRERKELKRMALAMAMGIQQHGEEEFEGFPGSGPALGAQSVGPGSGSVSTGSPFEEEFGPFAHGDDVVEEDADFGAETYVRRVPNGVPVGGSASDSQSRTSASISNTDYLRYNHHYLSQASPLPSPALSSGADAPVPPKKKKRSRGKSLSSKQSDERSHSTSSLLTSQSPSLPSPPPNQTAFDQPGTAIAPIAESDSHFEGFPGGTLDLAREHAIAQEDAKEPGDFPSIGLRGVQRTKSDMGVFLANRGHE
ncbi:uncharacterized protein C8Q71DRAFT_787178 [Rhodofomes roseus]|uniref:Uncharacterized protein n=1 Tax=Rhodofomes roseus TaxID=34475 RepID=A0ABQ8K0F9_9APHY|nr:uncharacterized protein C8Q71DRAFT_787178 [Rhodofomes roseus]KAH9830087.1 hypothetical protein C8Q71DRAFT_787178 [Rhodofomes roseus]